MVGSKSQRQTFLNQLDETRRQLEVCRVGVAVSVNALKYQNADIDVDIATALQRGVGDRLYSEIERIGALIARLKGERTPEPRKRIKS